MKWLNWLEIFWEGTFNALNLLKNVNFEHVGERYERYEIGSHICISPWLGVRLAILERVG